MMMIRSHEDDKECTAHKIEFVECSDDGALEDEEKTERSGFASGFRLVLAIVIIAIALYLLAPRIAGMFPGAEPFLTAYVAKIDALRLWLDGQVTAILQMFGDAPAE